jgi:hypothetical protein
MNTFKSKSAPGQKAALWFLLVIERYHGYTFYLKVSNGGNREPGMKCPKCNFDNPETNQFCGKCFFP